MVCAILALAALASGRAAAEIRPATDVLLPYFEVGFSPDRSPTTLLAVCNSAGVPVDVLFTVTTNWGIPMITLTRTLQPDEVASINLRDWLLYGRLPDRTLSPAELAHIQAALAGKPSPQDGYYYGTETVAGEMVGAVTMRSLGVEHRDSLWGDYFMIDPSRELFEGDTLVGLDPTPVSDALCTRHAVRFLEAGPFKDATELLIWTGRRLAPSKTPQPPVINRLTVNASVYDEPGKHVEDRTVTVLPVQSVRVCDLTVNPPFGWLEISTGDERSFIGAHYTSTSKPSAALHSYCLPEQTGVSGPAIHLEKSVNGDPADNPPGPPVPIGSTLTWTYDVTNSGTVRLTEVAVTDNTGLVVSCPGTTLEPGETMSCRAQSTAAACQNQNVGRAVGTAPDNTTVSDENSAYYFGQARAVLEIATLVEGNDADTPTGPVIAAGLPLHFTYRVTNKGDVNLTRVRVSDDQGVQVSCPKTALAPQETMTCTAAGTASGTGQHRHLGTAFGSPPCGGAEVSASNPAYYYVPGPPGISLVKLTNGLHADSPPGPTIERGAPVTWQYQVTNVGDVALTGIRVTDDRGVAVTCPKSALAAGESMVCTGSGTAVACQYTNVGTAVASVSGQTGTVTAHDTGYYFGQPHAALTIKTAVNGDDANTPTGPVITVGAPVQWTYKVTNSGDVALTGVIVTDDHGVAVSCPKMSLAVGETVTCAASGTAVRGQYHNIGTAVGTPPCGSNVTASDPAYYLGVAPAIALVKKTNGQHVDAPKGPTIKPGSSVVWTYEVTNTGDVTLTQVAVTDDHHVVVSCPKTALVPAESMTCTGQGTAISGQYHNIGTASGNPPDGHTVTVQDHSYYYGGCGDTQQGCSHGYWKTHTSSWPATGYSTGQTVESVFAEASRYSTVAHATLLQALSFSGGSNTEGAAQNLMKQAVAAVLNAKHPGVNYPLTAELVISSVNAALASQSRDTMLSLASQLDADNNLSCPLH